MKDIKSAKFAGWVVNSPSRDDEDLRQKCTAPY